MVDFPLNDGLSIQFSERKETGTKSGSLSIQMNKYQKISKEDSIFIDRLRGASILRVVLGHLGLGWLLLPYTSYIGIFLSVLFFCSGYILFHLYRKERSALSFLANRMLSVVLPFYLLYLVSVLIAAMYHSDTQHLSADHLYRGLMLAPNYNEMPFPLGQIWYLRVLLFCILICPPIFIAAKFSNYILLLAVLPGVVLSAIQTVHPVHSFFYWQGHSIYQAIVYGAYFFVGAFISTTNWRQNGLRTYGLATASIVIALIAFSFTERSYVLGDHAYAPNAFYFFLGIFGILFVLLIAPLIEWLYRHSKIIDLLLHYCGKHSYGIYLSHSFFIVFTEVTFGWEGVHSKPLLAASKIVFVIAASMVVAYPLTYISKSIILKLKIARYQSPSK